MTNEVQVSFSDILAGVRHDGNIAQREGFRLVAERARLLERELELLAANNPNCDFFLVARPREA